jgi:GH25 family lysozyme M1 (1,4-beta-N-acetylmuramidase)
VSSWQGSVNWPAVRSNGASFAYVKATEGTGYISPTFGKQYTGSYYAGLIRGAYHFALPDASTGAAQADHFVDHGGGWSNDGMTLPGALDIEYNPYGAMCYGYSPAGMVDWIWSFVNRYQARTGRYPVIYTNRGWWSTCTGDSSAFTDTDPLWVAAYSPTAGVLPGHWAYYTFWQYANAGPFPGDQNRFNGTSDRLQALARG